MEEVVVLVLCLLFPFLVLAFMTINRAARNIITEPPGPRAVPLMGNMLELGSKPHKSLARLAETHGPIMRLKLGQVNTIVVSSASMAREILQTHDLHFSNRAIPDSLRAHGQDKLGLPWVPVGPLWRTLRRICNIHLFAPKTLDASHLLRRQKLQDLLSHIGESTMTGASIDVGEIAFTTVLNFLSNSIISKDMVGPGSGSGRELKEIVWRIMVEAGKPNLSDYFPALKWIDPQGALRRMTKYFGQFLDVFEVIINERVQQIEQRKKKRDMLSLLIDICEDKNESLMEIFQIKHLFLDLFVAGSETTSSTLEWAMAELLHNPDKLSMVRVELDEVIGNGNRVEESDMSRLPYLQAVVKETLRLHPPVPLLLPRKAGATLEVGGYTIQEGSQVLVNAWAIGRDPNTWNDPNTFNPERFLGSDHIDVRGQHFELIPFGGGRRICPGLPLALRTLHLMLGSLIHSFDWELELGVTHENMDMDDKVGLTLQMAHPLRAIAIPKNV